MNVKELIDNQIERAGSYLDRVSMEFNATGRMNADAMIGCCAALFEIVQNQQAQIDELEDAQASIKVDVDDLVDAVGHEEQKHEEAHR